MSAAAKEPEPKAWDRECVRRVVQRIQDTWEVLKGRGGALLSGCKATYLSLLLCVY